MLLFILLIFIQARLAAVTCNPVYDVLAIQILSGLSLVCLLHITTLNHSMSNKSFLFCSLTSCFIFLSGCYRAEVNTQHTNQINKSFSSSQSIGESRKVSALGIIEPISDLYLLAAPLTKIGGSPRIKSIFVDEGDLVTKGQVLVSFDNSSELISERNRLEANITLKNNEILILENQIKRFEGLTDAGAFPISELEEKKLRIANFRTELRNLTGQLETIDERLKIEPLIRSPIDGLVLKINNKVAERASTDAVLEIGDTSQMQAVVEIDESDIKYIKIGQNAVITSENGSFSQNLNGKVSSVGLNASSKSISGLDPVTAPDSEVRVVEVKIALDSSSSLITQKLTGVKVLALITVSE